MNKKELIISAKFDTADFDKSVESMQKKLKEIYAPADMVRNQTQMAGRLAQMGMPGMSNPGQAGTQSAMINARRELEKQIQTEAQGQEKLGKFIAARVEKLKELKALQDTLNKGTAEELANREKISKVQENINRQMDMYSGRSQGLGQMMDARNYGTPAAAKSAMEAYQQGGLGGVGQYAGANKASIGGSIIGGIGAISGVMAGAGVAIERFGGYNQRLEQAKGSAISNSTGRDLEDVYAGRSAFEQAYKGEREQAAGLAEKKKGYNKIKDRLAGYGSVGLIGAGLVTGAASLAAAPFTFGGSTLGLPAAAGMVTAGVAGLSSDRNRKSIFGGKEYDQLLASEQAQDFRSNYENLKNQDPEKKLALENFEKNRLGYVSSQRQLGLSDSGFYGEGGFQQKATAAGFMPSQAMGMANSIIGAGGSTGMASNAAFGLQMERSGLTNAGSVLGTISGGNRSDPESTKRSTILIMSEAFKIGLDSTSFAEENRRFVQAAAEAVGRSGAKNGDALDIANTMGSFVGEKSISGIKSAQDQYEQYQGRSAQLGGRRGAIRFSEAGQDKNFGKLDTQELINALGAREDDMKEDSPGMQVLANKAGFTSVSQMKEARKKFTQDSSLQIPGNKAKMNKSGAIVQKYMDSSGKSLADITDESTQGKLDPEIQKALGEMDNIIRSERGVGMKDRDLASARGEFLKDNNSSKLAAGLIKTQKDLSGSDRTSDSVTGAAARDAEIARGEFDALAKSLREAASASGEFRKQAVENLPGLKDQAKSNRDSGPKANPSHIAKPMTQPQTGNSRGK